MRFSHVSSETSNEVTLVIMAAGMGSRFGGDKQLAEIGPEGEAILCYTLHDAALAGVNKLVLIVRSEIEEALREHCARFAPKGMEIVTRCQDKHGPSREKPWGTAHAVLSAADAITTPFLVVNADDHYGRSAILSLVEYLKDPNRGKDGAIAGFHLAETLSPIGGVSRGVFTMDDQNYMSSIVETHDIERNASGQITSDQGDLADDTLVSMQSWALDPSFLEPLQERFDAFVAANVGVPKAEFLLPDEIGKQVDEGRFRIKVLDTDAAWFGVTHGADLEPAQVEMKRLVDNGTYPAPLGG